MQIHFHRIRASVFPDVAPARLSAFMSAMNALGLAVLVGGAAFVCSGLIFLLPIERRLSASREAVQKNIDEIEDNLRLMRRELGDSS